jgi:hypothetical protein
MNITLPTYPELEKYMPDIEGYFEVFRKYQEDVYKIALDKSNKGFSVKTKTGYKLVSFCPVENNWRVTNYDEKGWPIGHTGYATQKEAYINTMESGIKFESIPVPEMSLDSKEEIIERVKSLKPREFDILTLITFYHIQPYEILR